MKGPRWTIGLPSTGSDASGVDFTSGLSRPAGRAGWHPRLERGRICFVEAQVLPRETLMTTLKEFEEALKEQGMSVALGILQRLRERDRGKRSASPARRVSGRKMTPEVAREILQLHASTELTQQEIAFRLGINQGRVNEVIKRGKWLSGDPSSPEALDRDRAIAKIRSAKLGRPGERNRPKPQGALSNRPKSRARGAEQRQLTFGEL